MPAPIARNNPYVWVTWITKLLSGETSCVWSAWFKAHYKDFQKSPSDFDSTKWQLDHTQLLRKISTKMVADGYRLTTEGQNNFNLKGTVGVLAGKPDLIAIKDKSGFIIDAKTGQPRTSDRVQVMLYMWAIPKAFPEFEKMTFDGKVIYTTGESVICDYEVTGTFIKSVKELLHEVCGSVEPAKIPSFAECRYCQITAEDCADRISAESKFEAETNEF